jgi:hypothetical protein
MLLIGRILYALGMLLGVFIFVWGLLLCLTFLDERFNLIATILGFFLWPLTLLVVPLWALISNREWELASFVYAGLFISYLIQAVGGRLMDKFSK